MVVLLTACGGGLHMQADMVLSSIGYRSVPLAGAPFDARLGILPNRRAPFQCGCRDWPGAWYAGRPRHSGNPGWEAGSEPLLLGT